MNWEMFWSLMIPTTISLRAGWFIVYQILKALGAFKK